MEACLIGLFSALAALLLKQGISWLGGYRLKIADVGSDVIVLPLLGFGFCAIAGLLVEQLSPTSGGGGIPQVKAALARLPVPLTFKVAIVKIIGTILVLGGGLTLGRRSPTVHIGAALAAELTNFVPTSPEHRRQMIAAGAAAGLAAGFNTPIAGVLFVIEELMRDISGLTLQTAIVASFTGAVVSLVLQENTFTLRQNLSEIGNISFSVTEIPFYLILGAIAGILGSIFNRSVLMSIRFNRSLKIPLYWRMGIAGLISGFIISQLPSIFRDNSGLREILIAGELNWETTALAFIAHFCLTILAAGSGAPGGLFAPALVMGSALGYLMGDFEYFLTGTGSASTYALVGMGAFFTAVVRVPITATIMVFELNGNFNLVLPLMITCAVAYLSAETYHQKSLDQHLLEGMGLNLEQENDHNLNNFLKDLKASDVMQSHVETIASHLPLSELLKSITKSHHRGFPVMENGKLVGIITQSDLEKVKSEKSSLIISNVMTKQPITVNSQAPLSNVLYLLNRYQLSRLPVIEGNKLIGIITRTDIIRAEVEGLTTDASFKPQKIYTCYKTRSPAIGKGRMLIPITIEDDYHGLFLIAAAIARYYEYEIEFVKVIEIDKHNEPRTTVVNSHEARLLMQRLERMGRKANLPIHTQIKIAHNRTVAILDIIKERHINLLLMGWHKKHHHQDVIFSPFIDNLINKVPCELLFVKLGLNQEYYPYNLLPKGCCLVPTAGGANAQEGLNLLPALLGIYPPQNLPSVKLAHVQTPTHIELDEIQLSQSVETLQDKLDTPIIPLCIRSNSVINALTYLADSENCELVILGASKESLLKQAIHGNIPDAIATNLDTTVIIVSF